MAVLPGSSWQRGFYWGTALHAGIVSRETIVVSGLAVRKVFHVKHSPTSLDASGRRIRGVLSRAMTQTAA
jgi:hypothetical protein